VQKILREQGPRFVMEQRPVAEDEKKAAKIEREIPDVAAEAAQSRGLGRPSGFEDQGAQLDLDALGAVLSEIEACYKILLAAKD
jgi:hypothetical protein